MLLYIMDVNYILEVVSWTWKKVATKKAKRHRSLKIFKKCNTSILFISNESNYGLVSEFWWLLMIVAKVSKN